VRPTSQHLGACNRQGHEDRDGDLRLIGGYDDPESYHGGRNDIQFGIDSRLASPLASKRSRWSAGFTPKAVGSTGSRPKVEAWQTART
jgi:hypothetical protein